MMQTMTDTANDIMSLDETVKFLRMERHAISRLVRARKLPGRKIGRVWRFSRRGLIRWLEELSARERAVM